MCAKLFDVKGFTNVVTPWMAKSDHTILSNRGSHQLISNIKKARHMSSFVYMVEGGGFEPPKAEPSDLQSDPFGHSGTPPNRVSLAFYC